MRLYNINSGNMNDKKLLLQLGTQNYIITCKKKS